MSRQAANRGSARDAQGAENTSGSADLHRLVRYSHIFASAVREILEAKLLREVTSFPLTVSQFHLLKLMAFNGRHQLGEVADFLGVSPPAATKNVDKLEGLGLVVRRPSKGDRRATLLSVSPKGRRLVRKYEELKVTRLSPVLESFRPEEIEQLSQLLERFALALLCLEASESEFCLRCAVYIESGCALGQIHGGCPYQKARQTRSGATDA
ncbi:MAG: MarR family winged helix-turn-helix transcriptional regulator [Phycisphaerae bacterium]